MHTFTVPWISALVVLAGVIGWVLAPWVALVYGGAGRALRWAAGCLAIMAGLSFVQSSVFIMSLMGIMSSLQTLAHVGFWGCIVWAIVAIVSASASASPSAPAPPAAGPGPGAQS
jgi:hypothetical protein